MTKRPQDFEACEIAGLAAAGQMKEVYHLSRIKIRDGRTSVARQVPTLFPFKKWSTNLPGTTYFLPVGDLTAMYINVLLLSFHDEVSLYIDGERNNFRGAGLAKYARLRGGRLHNNPQDRRISPINLYETIIVEFILAEQAFMTHNLSLVEQAMGLGGWTHYATSSEDDWLEELGFAMDIQKASRFLRAGPVKRTLMQPLGKDADIRHPLGLTVDGKDLVKPYCPPYYKSMEDAVLAFVEHKRAGLLQTEMAEGTDGTWKDRARVQAKRVISGAVSTVGCGWNSMARGSVPTVARCCSGS